ncbi:hypothetical protein N7513_004969 [Penicillium frequentans]|uniref:Mannosyl-oligosaccharide glucosidase n=1 Tax=Penicillium frequentans TaxID=3151616 RepID=A0AAD6CMV6_9EURO|nr:hypothetical protein N7494_012678 [Penicillium glabrum]KAJ5547735.1 hypothetical protein N7513_004969 [Penicillium glabrum]
MVLIDKQEYLSEEEKRLKEDRERTRYWKRWGPYVAERQWATVREDYSDDGDAWSYFSHDHARSRTFRWGEDGIAGVSDTHGIENIAFSFWNEKDEFLKERLFGLSNPQGNHGESVKEAHFHVDNTPTHSYMKFLYKYPQNKFPYEQLVEENAKRSRLEPEYQILDTDAFKDNRYWDIFIETAKEGDDADELLFRVIAYNRGPDPAPLHIVPQVWFRNTWSWGYENQGEKPVIKEEGPRVAKSSHHKLGERYACFAPSPPVGSGDEDIQPELLFTENETNNEKLWGTKNDQPYVKDAFHRYIVDDEKDAVNPAKEGTKLAAWYAFDNGDEVPPGECAVVRFRFSLKKNDFVDEEELDDVIEARRAEADDFYHHISPLPMSDDLRNIQRQAFSGMMWYSWEYPFFAAWDTAFHCIPLAMMDPDFAKKQLDLMTREWYMHPNGQLPAYEWNFGDVNPPVHAWAVFRTFKIERKMYGRQDLDFLERVFQKLLLNFTWWVNRKDFDGKNVFEGGFLGLDNIGLFNRSEPLPTGGVLEQADSTGWMAFYCLCMLNIALELAKHRRIYEDIASKFFEHFILISDAMTFRNGEDNIQSLWNEEDSFYYDAISYGGPWTQQLPIRSLVGLIPLYGVLTLEPELINKFPSFKRRLEWFVENKADVAERNIASIKRRGKDDRLLLALVSKDRLEKILKRMLDETEFLAKHGIRSMSKYHEENPYSMDVNGETFKVGYVPGDSDSAVFGGNSNWRGPIWLCVNFLLVESLLRFYMFYGDSFKVECPTGSGEYMHLGHVAEELQHRMQHLFARNDEGRRACNGSNDLLDFDEHWKDYMWFNEFFDGDSGRGLGTSHQCGWTGLIAKIIHDTGINCRLPQTPRGPFAAASHYFDDIFSRSTRGRGIGSRRPSVRRSSTNRSIGNRSDFNSTVAGDATPVSTYLDDEEVASPVSRRGSTPALSTNGDGEREEHINNYVESQLQRVRSSASIATYEDELETQAEKENGSGH